MGHKLWLTRDKFGAYSLFTGGSPPRLHDGLRWVTTDFDEGAGRWFLWPSQPSWAPELKLGECVEIRVVPVEAEA